MQDPLRIKRRRFLGLTAAGAGGLAGFVALNGSSLGRAATTAELDRLHPLLQIETLVDEQHGLEVDQFGATRTTEHRPVLDGMIHQAQALRGAWVIGMMLRPRCP